MLHNKLDTISPLRKIKIIPFNNLGHNTLKSIKYYTLPDVLYGSETWSLTLRKKA
jgi:hypothetical protein